MGKKEPRGKMGLNQPLKKQFRASVYTKGVISKGCAHVYARVCNKERKRERERRRGCGSARRRHRPK